MNHNMIGDLILNDALELYGQPKWTFGKNTCNTYEVFVEKVHMPDGDVIPAWPVVELIERDEALTLLFSRWFLENAMRFGLRPDRADGFQRDAVHEPAAPLCRSRILCG